MERLPLYIITSVNHRNTNLFRVGHDKAVEDSAAPTSCRMSFADILKRDYETNTYGFSPQILSMNAISIDEWELIRTKRLDKTMDTCIGIATYDSTKQFGSVYNYSNYRLLMVEFKLKCTSPRRVSMTDLLEKVRHTRSFFPNQAIDAANIFIFPVDLVSYYKADLTRVKNGSGKTNYANWEILSPADFNIYIAFEKDLPFHPLDTEAEIVSNITLAYGNDKASGLETALDFWKSRMEQYVATYRIKDATHVKQTVNRVLETILPKLSKEDKEYIAMEYSIFLIKEELFV